MKFREYYKLTKKTTINCLNISGIIFTIIFITLYIAIGIKTNSFNYSIGVFLLCILLGYGLGFFIWILAIAHAYSQMKMTYKLYDSIPIGVKESLGLELIDKLQNSKLYFLQFNILSTKPGCLYLFNRDKRYVWITIINNLKMVNNFQRRVAEITRKYKDEQVLLNGLGLSKYIHRKKWNSIREEDVNLILERLKNISNDEILIIVKN